MATSSLQLERALVTKTQSASAKPPDDTGLVTLELGLIAGSIFFLVLAVLTLGHMYYVSHELSRFVTSTARACVVAGKTDSASCQSYAAQQLQSARESAWYTSCGSAQAEAGGTGADQGSSGPAVQVSASAGIAENVSMLSVTMTCNYAGITQSELLARNNLTLKTLHAQASYPYATAR